MGVALPKQHRIMLIKHIALMYIKSLKGDIRSLTLSWNSVEVI